MIPVEFPESNGSLAKPSTMTDEECKPLPCWRDGYEVISCWRASWRERLSVLFRGRVWLRVVGGRTQPPVSIEAKRTVFEEVRPC